MALKAFEIDQELPEVHDILALIDEQLSAGAVRSTSRNRYGGAYERG